MNRKIIKNKGMTYIELIVVLSIFAVLASVVLFQYGGFQARINLKNLTSDIALNIVSAQKQAGSGLLPSQIPTVSPWKPAYGVYFNITGLNQGADTKDFIYYTDLNNNDSFDDEDCTGECINKISITKNDTISNLSVFYIGDSSAHSLNDLTVTFRRPDGDARITSATALDPNIAYVQITVTSPESISSLIKIYPSGRLQVN